MTPRNTASSTASSSITRRSGVAAAALTVLAAAAVLVLPGPPNAARAGTPAVAATSGGRGFSALKGAVAPREAVPWSAGSQKIIFRFGSRQPSRVDIRIQRLAGGKVGRTVRRFVTAPLRPGRWQRRIWNGLDGRGRLVGAGRYRVRVGPAGGRLRTLARIRLHGHTFPVDGPHGTRGYIGEFGAPRTGGRTHEGFDVTASCGTPLVALRSGTILKTAYDPALKGYYVVLKGRSERRTYLYAHLAYPASVTAGQKVRAGRRIGTVGQTGNAASTPCHLHIEVRTRGRLLDPGALLPTWDW